MDINPTDKVSSAKNDGDTHRPIEEECRDLRQRVEQLEAERNGYYGEWQHAKNQLQEIHSSRMWRLWMTSISLRGAPRAIARRIAGLGRAARDGTTTVGQTTRDKTAAVGQATRDSTAAVGRATRNGTTAVGRAAGKGTNAVGRALASAWRATLRLLGSVYLYPWVWSAKLGALFRGTSEPAADLPATDPAIVLAGRRPRVLMVSPYPLYPPNHGSATRSFNLIKELAPSCDVYLLIFSRTGHDPIQVEGLEPYCRRIDFFHWVPRFKPETFELSPPGARLFASDRAAAKIRDIVLGFEIDIVQLEHTELGQYASAVPKRARVILSEIDIAFLTHQRRRELRFNERFEESRAFGSTRNDLYRLLRFEVRCARKMDQVHTMSAVDGEALSRFLPGGTRRIRVIPNGVSVDDFEPPSPAPDRGGVLFLGNFGHLPNVDALEYLITDIWPLLRLDQPDAQLSVVGANAGDRVQHFESIPGVTIVGEVPDTRPAYHGHRLMVAPIRAGSGTRLKILEAFAAGTPVVSTTLGAEGLGAEHGTHLLLADGPADFARAVHRLLSDDGLRSSMADAARAFVREHYDWPKVAARSLAAYAELMTEQRGDSSPTAVSSENRKYPRPSAGDAGDTDVSVVIPTLNGGDDLDRCLDAIGRQVGGLRTEVLCVDSGSVEADLETMRRHGAEIHPIEKSRFNHGLTRDLGARLTTGRTIVFLNQDAVPADEHWLERLVTPFEDGNDRLAAVQGGIAELPSPDDRFYWDSCGQRFYFTSESDRWIAAHNGIGFSTVNCAIRRDIWDRIPFGWASIMEDKKWQREITDAGYEIVMQGDALVRHTHTYPMRSLLRRCSSEGYGWRTLGESYSLPEMAGDMLKGETWRDLARGIRQRRVRTPSELFFPWLRPLALYWGNHMARDVTL